MSLCGFILQRLTHHCHVKKLEIVGSDYNNANLYFEMTFSLPFPSSLLKVPTTSKGSSTRAPTVPWNGNLSDHAFVTSRAFSHASLRCSHDNGGRCKVGEGRNHCVVRTGCLNNVHSAAPSLNGVKLVEVEILHITGFVHQHGSKKDTFGTTFHLHFPVKKAGRNSFPISFCFKRQSPTYSPRWTR